jgi:hypothetical protein
MREAPDATQANVSRITTAPEVTDGIFAVASGGCVAASIDDLAW